MFRKRLWAFQETLKPLEGHTERILKRAKEYCEVGARQMGPAPPKMRLYTDPVGGGWLNTAATARCASQLGYGADTVR